MSAMLIDLMKVRETSEMFISMQTSDGEVSIPGYRRQPVFMQDMGDGTPCYNSGDALWELDWPATTLWIRAIGLHVTEDSPPVIVVNLDMAQVVSAARNDTVTVQSKALKVPLSVPTLQAVIRGTTTRAGGFDEFVAANPNATAKEVWDAAFVAGSNFTHRLLTGDAYE